MLRYLTAGESLGQALVAVVEGLPSGLPITAEEISAEPARRRLGFGRRPRRRFEPDELTPAGGVRYGRTSGSPVAIEITDTEWPKLKRVLDPATGALVRSPSRLPLEREKRYHRGTSRAGGIEGGMSTGDPVVVRAAMHPLSTLNRPVPATVDTRTILWPSR